MLHIIWSLIIIGFLVSAAIFTFTMAFNLVLLVIGAVFVGVTELGKFAVREIKKGW